MPARRRTDIYDYKESHNEGVAAHSVVPRASRLLVRLGLRTRNRAGMVAMSEDSGNRILDMFADLYKAIKAWMAERPIQLLAYMVGLLVIIGVYTAITATSNSTHIDQVKAALCNSDSFDNRSVNDHRDQQIKCQRLFSKLLEHPTPQQARRLKQIVKEAP